MRERLVGTTCGIGCLDVIVELDFSYRCFDLSH